MSSSTVSPRFKVIIGKVIRKFTPEATDDILTMVAEKADYDVAENWVDFPGIALLLPRSEFFIFAIGKVDPEVFSVYYGILGNQYNLRQFLTAFAVCGNSAMIREFFLNDVYIDMYRNSPIDWNDIATVAIEENCLDLLDFLMTKEVNWESQFFLAFEKKCRRANYIAEIVLSEITMDNYVTSPVTMQNIYEIGSTKVFDSIVGPLKEKCCIANSWKRINVNKDFARTKFEFSLHEFMFSPERLESLAKYWTPVMRTADFDLSQCFAFRDPETARQWFEIVEKNRNVFPDLLEIAVPIADCFGYEHPVGPEVSEFKFLSELYGHYNLEKFPTRKLYFNLQALYGAILVGDETRARMLYNLPKPSGYKYSMCHMVVFEDLGHVKRSHAIFEKICKGFDFATSFDLSAAFEKKNLMLAEYIANHCNIGKVKVFEICLKNGHLEFCKW